jgi:DNA repair exonuclease SbcCD nuclease subunit
MRESFMLMRFVLETAKSNKVDRVEFLGDLFHTHAVLRLEVVQFWDNIFKKFNSEGIKVIALAGNHDMKGDYNSKTTALDVFVNKYENITIVNKPLELDGFLYVPYQHSQSEFEGVCLQSNCHTLVCHQTFDGAQNDNGTPARDGFGVKDLPFNHIISGHLHSSHSTGKVFYPGTAKWDTLSDANKDKGIFLFDHKNNGDFTFNFISTEDICIPIKVYEFIEGDPIPEIPEKSKVYVTLTGKFSWISRIKKEFPAHVKIKPIPTDRVIKAIGDIQELSIQDYLDKYFVLSEDVDKDQILSILDTL